MFSDIQQTNLEHTYFLVKQGKSVSIPLNVSNSSWRISGTLSWGRSISNFFLSWCKIFKVDVCTRLSSACLFMPKNAGSCSRSIFFLPKARTNVLNLAAGWIMLFPEILFKAQLLQAGTIFNIDGWDLVSLFQMTLNAVCIYIKVSKAKKIMKNILCVHSALKC